MKSISVIGSTGSIGQSTLNVARRLGYNVAALTAYRDLEKLKKQDQQFNPQYVGVVDESVFKEAKALFGRRLVCGREALTFSCSLAGVNTVVISVVGLNGIFPLLETLKNGKRAALANKESLVAAGETALSVLEQNKQKGAEIIPVDSEHSAVFQCLKCGKPEEVKRLILTASGGAFYTCDQAALDKIAPADIYHPNWKMGRKITIDSCTMMNKALEIVEARWLFDCRDIDYAVHTESIVHSLVEFKDGSVMAQLAPPDMELPIQYALTYPDRLPSVLPTLNLTKPLNFLPRNPLFYAPELGIYAVKAGGAAGTILNSANEAAVGLFENGQIKFTDIAKIVKNCLFMSDIAHDNSLDDILELHNSTKEWVKKDYSLILNSTLD